MCAWAGEQYEIYQGVSRFLKAEGNEHSILAYFDYGINNGWKVHDPTAFTSTHHFTQNNPWLNLLRMSMLARYKNSMMDSKPRRTKKAARKRK